MSQERILYIHHAKDFSSNQVYLSDDFHLANRSLFGAQEMDSWAGYRLLKRDFLVYRLQISTNLSAIQLISPDGLTLRSIEIKVPRSLRDKTNFQYVRALVKFLDPSFAIYSDQVLRDFIDEIINELEVSVIWSDTQFYGTFIPSKSRTIIRSVNFEPFHVLREDPSPFRLLKAMGKTWSERSTLKNNSVVAISPRDAHFYSKLINRRIGYLPLRQLGFLLEQPSQLMEFSQIINQPFLYFAGSNFDVKHNRDNLVSLVEEIAPALALRHPEILILIFGHRFPRDLKIPPNVKQMYFRNDFHSLTSHALASLVPGRGGAGMQSKIFEPLCRGIPLIANSEAISGYPFTTFDHYWNGDSVEDIIQSINNLRLGPSEAIRRATAAKMLALSLFSISRLQTLMNELVHES